MTILALCPAICFAESFKCQVKDGVSLSYNGTLEKFPMYVLDKGGSFIVDSISGRIISSDQFLNNDGATRINIVSQGLYEQSLAIVSERKGILPGSTSVNTLSVWVWRKSEIPFWYQIWGGWYFVGTCEKL
jgi:hypothetical protein